MDWAGTALVGTESAEMALGGMDLVETDSAGPESAEMGLVGMDLPGTAALRPVETQDRHQQHHRARSSKLPESGPEQSALKSTVKINRDAKSLPRSGAGFLH
jgi:hypothetical protein